MIIRPRIIDISHYNNVKTGGFTAARKFGIRGCIHKATEGASSRLNDPFYRTRQAPCQATPMLWGAYHFLRPGNVALQWNLFLGYTKPDENTLLAIDYEVAGLSVSMATEFATAIEARTGCSAVLYGPRALLMEALGTPMNAFWKKRRIWLAEYNSAYHIPASWPRPWAWQFTGDGQGPSPHTIPGIDGWCDVSSFAGTDADLTANWARMGIAAREDIARQEIFRTGGRMSWFGGPQDTGVASNEGLAFFTEAQLRSHGLGDFVTRGKGGLARRLNPAKPYLACRWDYKKTPPEFLRNATAIVTNPKNDKSLAARPMDWGPNSRTGRVADLSPGLMKGLGLETDGLCTVVIYKDGKP